MYEAQNFDHLLGTPGFSDVLLQNHFTLYKGYVKNTNLLFEELKKLENEKQTALPQYAELQRRLGWEWNGMRLHELYFENISKNQTQLTNNTLTDKINSEYGSIDNWKKNFIDVGSMRGIGWVILCYDAKKGEIFNVWINEHDGGHLVGAQPLLVMDVFEHAFMIDYGLNRKDYIAAFCDAIDWEVLTQRFDSAQRA